MRRIIKKTYSFTKEYSALSTQILLIGAAAMIMLYAFDVYRIISRTIATRDIESQTASMQKSVQDLDAQYISLLNKITPDLAQRYGLHEGTVSAYIPRTPSLGRAVSFGQEL